MMLAAIIIALMAGAIVLSIQTSNHEFDLQQNILLNRLNIQTGILAGDATQSPQPPQNYYCANAFYYNINATGTERFQTVNDCEATP